MCFSLLFIILICARKAIFSLFLDIEALILYFFMRRYMCTITGISDLDPIKWTKSQWRNIQVFIGENICFISCQISKVRVPEAEMLLKFLALHV